MCHGNFQFEQRICYILGITPSNGKVCFNSVPNVIAEKFNQNPSLFLEFKNLLTTQKEEDCAGKLWTFPQFKVSETGSSQGEIVFPDPKYYMIGFTLSVSDDMHEEDLDPNIS